MEAYGLQKEQELESSSQVALLTYLIHGSDFLLKS
jgi:hypothetical protein